MALSQRLSRSCASVTGTRQLSSACASRCGRPSSRRPMQVKALFGGGGGGGMPGMGGLMESLKKAQEMVKVETERVQKELSETEFEGYDEDELVRVVVSGNQEPKAIDVTEAAMKLTAEELSARLTAAAKDAHSNSVANMKAKMRDLAGKLGLPQAPGGGLPGM